MPAPWQAQAPDRDVALTIPARPEYLVLARLALSAVCRLTPLSPEEVADLKLAVTEAANDFVDEDCRRRGAALNVSFALEDAAAGGQARRPARRPSRPASRSSAGRSSRRPSTRRDFEEGRTELVKYLPEPPG